jgi:esterase/lipase
MPLVDVLALCCKHYRMSFGYDTRQKPHVEHWDLDPKHLGMAISMHTLQEFVRTLDNINNKNLFDKVNCALLLLTASEDLVVDNYKLRELLDRANTKYKRMVQFVNADHKLLSDGEYFQLAM